MNGEYFIKDRRLPFAEVLYSRSSKNSFKPHLHQAFSVGAMAVERSAIGCRKRVGSGRWCLALINPDTLHACNCEASQQRR
ncbi:MAG: hypothetical protein KJ804_17780 [Proteobacteria bacterium]|nr:hypothetical protein [Pseudomonadota bacterium]MBU1060159.1 hypothetical protein [Pseudomonadota bacterium]